jgi:TDG/mug DNA glycosylase family protein
MRATTTADQLTREELRDGGKRLAAKVRRYKPDFLAVLGLGAYRTAWQRPQASIGRQEEMIGETIVWVLPNPSGLNAHYQAKDLALVFRKLKADVDKHVPRDSSQTGI